MGPVAAFQAHWAPNGMVRYDRKNFPSRYRDGVFLAFHGSWNRASYAQGGYNVVFQPLEGDRASGTCEIFADGFAAAKKTPEGATSPPTRVALRPHGAPSVFSPARAPLCLRRYPAQPPRQSP